MCDPTSLQPICGFWSRITGTFSLTLKIHGAMPLSLWTPLPAPVVPRLPLSPHRVPRIPRVPRLQRGLRGATAAAAVSATWSLAQRRGAQGGEVLLQALQRNGFVTVELSGAEEKVLGEAEMVDGELRKVGRWRK